MLLINGKYVIGKQLGSGSFGDIYIGMDQDEPKNSPKKLSAIKLEPRDASLKLLEYEANVYRYLYREGKGIPNIYWSGVQDDYNIMVIEMLGPNFENLLKLCGRRFSLKTTICIDQELIRVIQYIHSKGVIHRDIKPENFLIGFKSNKIYAIDFGLCKMFKNKDRTHIPFSDQKKLVGTVRYASINSHHGFELSRRDDLESIGYIIVYFLKGSLPWQGLGKKGMTREEKYDLIYKCKQNTTMEQLCQGLPKEVKMYMEYVKSLDFTDKPSYNYVYNLFTQLFKKKKFSHNDQFDWSRSIPK